MQDIPKIVRARLQRPEPAADTHPDADLLTAFAEQSLAGQERELVTQHLARCGDCREVVVLSMPANQVAVVGTSAPSSSGWLSFPVFRWSVITAGILAVVSVGMIQLRERQEKTASTVLMARSQAEDASSKISAHLNEPPPLPGASSQALSGRAGQREAALRHNFASSPQNPSVPLRAKQSPSSFSAQSVEPTVPEAQPAAAQSSGLNGAENRATQDDDAEQTRVGKAKAALPQTSPAMAAAPALRSDPGLMKIVIQPRWTISSSGALQRSLDGGKTWTDISLAVNNPASANLVSHTQNLSTAEARPETKKLAKEDSQIPSATIFRALSVSSNASEVWAGGSDGALYHTFNAGNLWVLVVPSGAGAPLTGDIVSIQFTDARNGKITTSSAEVWITSDDGQNWTKQQ